MASSERRVGIYVRASTDRAGIVSSCSEQEARCLDLCEDMGWTSIVAVYADEEPERYQARPGFDWLVDDVRADELDIVLVWRADRLARMAIELDDLMDLFATVGVELRTEVIEGTDVTSRSGRARIKAFADLDRAEARELSARSSLVQQGLAREGRVGNGGPRPFGFEANRKTIRKDEARLIRAAAKRILTGATPLDIRRSWESRGVPTSTGAAWSTTAIRKLLTSPRVAGLRLHPTVGEVDAEWPPILDRDTWDRLCEVLPDPAKRRASVG